MPRDAATEQQGYERATNNAGQRWTYLHGVWRRRERERERERVTDTLPDGHRLSRCGKGYAEGRQPTRSYDENRVV